MCLFAPFAFLGRRSAVDDRGIGISASASAKIVSAPQQRLQCDSTSDISRGGS